MHLRTSEFSQGKGLTTTISKETEVAGAFGSGRSYGGEVVVGRSSETFEEVEPCRSMSMMRGR